MPIEKNQYRRFLGIVLHLASSGLISALLLCGGCGKGGGTAQTDASFQNEFKEMDQGLFDSLRVPNSAQFDEGPKAAWLAHGTAEAFGRQTYGREVFGKIRDVKEAKDFRDKQLQMVDRLNDRVKRNKNIVDALKSGWSYGFDSKLRDQLENQQKSLKEQIDKGDTSQKEIYETLKQEIDALSKRIENEQPPKEH